MDAARLAALDKAAGFVGDEGFRACGARANDPARRHVLVDPRVTRSRLTTVPSSLRISITISGKRADVHLDHRNPHVVIRFGGRGDSPTKSGKPRTVFLNQSAIAHLQAWLAQLDEYTARKRFPNGRNPLELAFVKKYGGQRCEEHVVRWANWLAIKKAPPRRIERPTNGLEPPLWSRERRDSRTSRFRNQFGCPRPPPRGRSWPTRRRLPGSPGGARPRPPYPRGHRARRGHPRSR